MGRCVTPAVTREFFSSPNDPVPAFAPLVPAGVRLTVAEIQGLYGPFSFSEKLFQKIWLRVDFDRRSAVTTDGRAVQILQAGKWNLLGGPDFKGARLQIGEARITGDVELHLHAEDWAGHRHASDPAYNSVILHVVLFPPPVGHTTLGADGRAIPVLPLLHLLYHDLEEYAATDAVELLASRPSARAMEELKGLSRTELATLLQGYAAQRWHQKVRFARLRIDRLGWSDACHHVALEILGYRFNRVPMLRVAGQFPLSEWGGAGAAMTVERAWASEKDAWSVQGVRPANRPLTRLRQYGRWVQQRSEWPSRLEQRSDSLPRGLVLAEAGAARFRRTHHLTELRRTLCEAVGAGVVGGTRFDNLVCDGFLPLLAAQTGGEFGAVWFNWFVGDQPPEIVWSLRLLGAIELPAFPSAHGVAQGFLGWLIERETRLSVSASAPEGRGA